MVKKGYHFSMKSECLAGFSEQSSLSVILSIIAKSHTFKYYACMVGGLCEFQCKAITFFAASNEIEIRSLVKSDNFTFLHIVKRMTSGVFGNL